MSTDLPPAIDPDDPPEDWFWEWDNEARRTLRERIMQWWRRH